MLAFLKNEEAFNVKVLLQLSNNYGHDDVDEWNDEDAMMSKLQMHYKRHLAELKATWMKKDPNWVDFRPWKNIKVQASGVSHNFVHFALAESDHQVTPTSLEIYDFAVRQKEFLLTPESKCLPAVRMQYDFYLFFLLYKLFHADWDYNEERFKYRYSYWSDMQSRAAKAKQLNSGDALCAKINAEKRIVGAKIGYMPLSHIDSTEVNKFMPTKLLPNTSSYFMKTWNKDPPPHAVQLEMLKYLNPETFKMASDYKTGEELLGNVC